jgi:hypothetical protein
MKLFIYASFCFMLNLSAMNAAERPDPSLVNAATTVSFLTLQAATEVVGPILSIEFGRRKFGCTKFGICHLKYDDSDSLSVNPKTARKSARGTASVVAGKLTVEFFRSSMNPDTYNTFFEGEVFIVEEDFPVPTDVTTVLGLGSYTIKAGVYPVTKLSNQNLLVTY